MYNNNIQETTCAICTLEFDHNSKVHITECCHVYHSECVKELINHSQKSHKDCYNCPLCRTSIEINYADPDKITSKDNLFESNVDQNSQNHDENNVIDVNDFEGNNDLYSEGSDTDTNVNGSNHLPLFTEQDLD